MAMTSYQIKKALKKNGWTYSRVAQLTSPPLSVGTISKNVLKIEGGKSRRAREAIAQAVGLPIERVYGSAA